MVKSTLDGINIYKFYTLGNIWVIYYVLGEILYEVHIIRCFRRYTLIPNTNFQMPKSYTVGASTKRTTDLKIPVKSDGTADHRFKVPQFVKSDGTRDKRTTLTSSRK